MRSGSASASPAPSAPPGGLRRASTRPGPESSASARAHQANPSGPAGSRHAGARASKTASEPGPAQPRPATKWRRPSRLCRYRAAPRFGSSAAAGRPLPAGAGPSPGPCGAGCLPQQAAEPFPGARVPVARCAPRSCALRAVLRAASFPPPSCPGPGGRRCQGRGWLQPPWLVVHRWGFAAKP